MFYLRREHLGLLRPVGVGWHSVEHASDYSRIELNFKPSAGRYEGGTQNMVGFLGLADSLEILLELGQEAIGQRLIEITDLACEQLQRAGATLASPREGDHRSGIVSFEMPGQNSLEVKHRCLAAGVVLHARGGKLRIAPHAYCNEEDIGRLIESLAR